MSLRVWLPLNGNLNNYGISDITVTNNGATVDNNGKMGKCYSFNGTSAWIKATLPSDMTTLKNTSIAMWAKGNRSFGGISHNSGSTLATCTFFTSWQFADGSNWIYKSSGSATDGNWHHICITMNDTNIITYCDGIQITVDSWGSLLSTLTSSHFIEIGCDHPGGDEYGAISVNDFRIYDHCLSAKEVKEISKGLCLHYQLKGFGQENLVKNSAKKVISDNYLVTSYELSEALVLNQIYTITMKAKLTSDLKWIGIWSDYGSTNFAACQARNENNFYKWTVTCNSSNATHKIFSIYASNNDVGVMQGNTPKTGTCEIEWIKLEEGSVATPWCPNSADSLYSTLGFNTNIEPDCSGFGNDGTKSGTIICDIDSPRYTTSYHFSNSQSINYTENLTFLTTSSISFWAKFNAKGASGWLPFSGQDGNYFIMATSGGTGNFYNGGITASGTIVYYEDSKVVSAPTNDGKWHHYAITGVNMSTWTVFKINNYIDSTWNSDVNYADVRVYNTILSAEDILELYNSPINIDNKGNLYAYEFIEEDKNNFSKQGIAKNSEFIDLDTAGGSYTNASISSTVDYANIFIEK